MTSRSITMGSISILVFAAMTLPAYAQTGASAIRPQPRKNADTACILAAVDARESALGAAFTAFASSQSAALAARKSALSAAWGTTDTTARRTVRDKAWSDYRTAEKTSRTTLRTAGKTAWTAFKTASKACGVEVAETPSTEGTTSLGL
jgi:hypothetical protein